MDNAQIPAEALIPEQLTIESLREAVSKELKRGPGCRESR